MIVQILNNSLAMISEVMCYGLPTTLPPPPPPPHCNVKRITHWNLKRITRDDVRL